MSKIPHEDLYRKIVENSEEGIWIINENSVTTYANQKMADILGYSVDEMMGRDMYYFMTPENVGTAKHNMANRMQGVKEVHDFIFRTKVGKKIWTAIAASPLKDKTGKFVGALGMVQDITARRRSETLLEAQRKIFELLVMGASLESALEVLTNAIEYLTDDVKASILLLDEEGLRLWTGADPNLPKEYSEAIHGKPIGPREGSCGTSAYEKKLIIVSDIQTDPLWEKYREIALRNNLRSCWSSPIFSRDHKVLGTFALYSSTIRVPDEYELQLIQDATAASALSIEHKRTQQNLKVSRDNASFLAEARKSLSLSLDPHVVLKEIPHLIVSHFADWCFLCQTDKDGNLETLAASAEISKTHLIHQFEKYRPDMKAPEGLPRAIRNKESVLYIDVKDSQIEPDASGWPIVGTKDPEILKVMKELGIKSYMAIPIIVRNKCVGGLFIASAKLEHQYKNDDLLLANELAGACAMAIDNGNLYRESQKAIAAREVFISVASHEFRTPLTILRGRIDLLSLFLEKSHVPPELFEKIKSTLHGLATQTERISKLVEALLNVSKIRTGRLFLNKEQIDISQLIHDIVLRMRPEFEAKKCPLEVSIQNNIKGNVDSLRLEQVVSNLLSNALKFGEHKPVVCEVTGNQTNMIIQVADQGMGISPQDQERIFECFERAASEKHYSGLGLGLYISKQIVMAHGGDIKVKSEACKGTTFTVELPLNQ